MSWDTVENAFMHDGNLVSVPYCSSDAWSGTVKATQKGLTIPWQFVLAIGLHVFNSSRQLVLAIDLNVFDPSVAARLGLSLWATRFC